MRLPPNSVSVSKFKTLDSRTWATFERPEQHTTTRNESRHARAFDALAVFKQARETKQRDAAAMQMCARPQNECSTSKEQPPRGTEGTCDWCHNERGQLHVVHDKTEHRV